jgi:hypothetical protein
MIHPKLNTKKTLVILSLYQEIDAYDLELPAYMTSSIEPKNSS